MPRRAFSALDEINGDTVKNLRVATTFSLGTDKGAEAAPIVVGNTMYVITPWPNYVYALDLTKPGAPLKWAFHPNPARAAQGVACCDVVNRGVASDNGKILFNTLDDQTMAVDATPASCCGAPVSAASRPGRPSPWRRWW